MNKNLKTFACICMLAGLMTGCSMKDDDVAEDVNKSTEKAVDDTKKAAEDAKDATEDSIDNVMNYFDEQGIAYENMQTINNMEFAAHEGRSFMMNGQTAYLYRVKSDDEDMKKIMQEAQNSGKVKVKVDNKEQEYGALVNGDYLLVYNTAGDNADMQKAFPNYQPTGVHGSDAQKDTTNNKTTADEE